MYAIFSLQTSILHKSFKDVREPYISIQHVSYTETKLIFGRLEKAMFLSIYHNNKDKCFESGSHGTTK